MRLASLLLFLAIAFAPVAGRADDFASVIARQLRGYGYGSIEIERTLLGRIRIAGLREGFTREVVIDPQNGVILRDRVYRASRRILGILDWSSEPSPSTGEIGGSAGSGGSGYHWTHGGHEDSEDSEDGGEEDEEDEEDEDHEHGR